MPAPPLLTPADLADGAGVLALAPDGAPLEPLALVDLAAPATGPVLDAARAAATASHRVLVGACDGPVPEGGRALLAALSLTLAGRADSPEVVATTDLSAAVAALADSVTASPRAAVTAVGLLRLTTAVEVPDALVAESLAYSTLLAGPEFARWRAARPQRPSPPAAEPVLLSRSGDTVRLVLNRPERHNAFSREVRDALVDALDLALLDASLGVELSGNGPSFCSGGDLDEFGTAPDPATAHLVRVTRSAGLAVHRCADRVRVRLHGACIGAGVEVPAFAGRVEARPDAWFQLPELRMGLVPGAGGTASLPRRIGRWRTAWLVLSGRPLDLGTALGWGLVDARVD